MLVVIWKLQILFIKLVAWKVWYTLPCLGKTRKSFVLFWLLFLTTDSFLDLEVVGNSA